MSHFISGLVAKEPQLPSFQSMDDSRKVLRSQEPVQFRSCSQGDEVALFSEHELLKEGLVAQEPVPIMSYSQGASVAQF